MTGIGANAQWATFNISDALYDYFRSMRDYVQNSNLKSFPMGSSCRWHKLLKTWSIPTTETA